MSVSILAGSAGRISVASCERTGGSVAGSMVVSVAVTGALSFVSLLCDATVTAPMVMPPATTTIAAFSIYYVY